MFSTPIDFSETNSAYKVNIRFLAEFCFPELGRLPCNKIANTQSNYMRVYLVGFFKILLKYWLRWFDRLLLFNRIFGRVFILYRCVAAQLSISTLATTSKHNRRDTQKRSFHTCYCGNDLYIYYYMAKSSVKLALYLCTYKKFIVFDLNKGVVLLSYAILNVCVCECVDLESVCALIPCNYPIS